MPRTIHGRQLDLPRTQCGSDLAARPVTEDCGSYTRTLSLKSGPTNPERITPGRAPLVSVYFRKTKMTRKRFLRQLASLHYDERSRHYTLSIHGVKKKLERWSGSEPTADPPLACAEARHKPLPSPRSGFPVYDF